MVLNILNISSLYGAVCYWKKLKKHEKKLKNIIFITKWCVKHPFAGQNTHEKKTFEKLYLNNFFFFFLEIIDCILTYI